MKKSALSNAALAAFLVLAPLSLHAANTAEQAKLQKEAKISMDEAKEIALKHVKKDSRIASSELEREHGKLIYSFDIREPNRNDVTEVNVNAIDGTIVAIDHENAKKEAAEAKQEAAASAGMQSSVSEQAKLQKEAKISMDEAKEIALKHVKKDSKIESSELEREHGKLIYSFDIREPHRKDITEVNVNAIDGKIVAIDHENPAKEAAEKKQEAKEKH